MNSFKGSSINTNRVQSSQDIEGVIENVSKLDEWMAGLLGIIESNFSQPHRRAQS